MGAAPFGSEVVLEVGQHIMNLSSARNLNSPLLLFCPCGPSLLPLYCSVGHCPFTLVPPPPPPAVYIHVLSAHMFISSHLLLCTRPFHQLTLNSPHSVSLCFGIRRRSEDRTRTFSTTDMSDSETAAAPAEAPVPAACASIKADLDKW